MSGIQQTTTVIVRPVVTVAKSSPTSQISAVHSYVGLPGKDGAPGSGGNETLSFERTFTQADLSIAGILPVVHGLNSYPSAVTVFDEWGVALSSTDGWANSSVNAIAIDLSSFAPIAGTWRVSITS